MSLPCAKSNEGAVARKSAVAVRRNRAGSTLMRLRHCSRRPFFCDARGEDGAVDSAHFLDLHPQFDDFDLVETGHIVGALALLALAKRDAIGQPDELPVRAPVRPSSAAEAEKRMGRSANVPVIHEAERSFVPQLGADIRPLLEDGADDDQRKSSGNDQEEVPLADSVTN